MAIAKNAWEGVVRHKRTVEDDTDYTFSSSELPITVFHKFKIGDVEEPDLWAAEKIYEWQISEAGQWVMENCVGQIKWERYANLHTFGYDYAIFGKLSERAYIYYSLRWK